MYWKVVHLQWPYELEDLPIDSGYAVASVMQEPVIGCYQRVMTNLVVVRYSGYELLSHALVHCNNLNIWNLTADSQKLWPLLMVNSEFLYDAV